MQGVLDHVREGPSHERPVDHDPRQGGGQVDGQLDPAREPGAVRVENLAHDVGEHRGFPPHRGRRGEAGELRRDPPQQPDLREDRIDAVAEHRPQRFAAVPVHAQQVLGRKLDRRQRVLDVVGHLPRHLRPGLEPVGALEPPALDQQIPGHAVERRHQALEFVGRADRHPRVEVAARDAARRAGQPLDRIRDPLRDVEAAGGAEKDEQGHAEQDPAVEIADLPFDVPLPRGQRHGQDRVGAGRADGRRRDQIVLRAERVPGHERRRMRQNDRVVHIGRGTGRQQAGGEEVALAGGDQPRARVDVDVLLDDLADEDQQIVGHDGRGGVGGLLELGDHALGDDGGPRRAGLHVGAEPPGGVVADQQGQDQHRNGRDGDEGQEQTAVEADPQLADQLPAQAVPLRGERSGRRQDQNPRSERGAGQGDDLGQPDEVIERGEHGIPERVDAGAVVRDVYGGRPPAGPQRGPERFP